MLIMELMFYEHSGVGTQMMENKEGCLLQKKNSSINSQTEEDLCIKKVASTYITH